MGNLVKKIAKGKYVINNIETILIDDTTAEQPIVSVTMITYGHQEFIRQAIEGVLMQKTTFEFVLVIGEDKGFDQTRNIIIDYQVKHPDKIILKLPNKNLGVMANSISNKYFCNGKYIAECEGDDYWTDPLKLQKQVDFLESNPDYAICFHKVNILRNGIEENDTVSANVPQTTTILDLAKGNYIHTCSVVFRNNLFAKLPAYYKKAPVGDYFLHLLNARYGSIKYIDQTMGIYRIHGSSTWSSKTPAEQINLWVPFLRKIKPNFDKSVQQVIDNQIYSYTKHIKNKNLKYYAIVLKSKIILKIKRLLR